MGLLEKICKYEFVPYNIVRISALNLLNNVKIFEDLTKLEVMPVLKANAYGHGIREIAQILNQAKMVKMVVVDGYFEANKLRMITEKKILVMNPTTLHNMRLTNHRKMSFVVADLDDLETLAKTRFRVKIHLKINTGMNRLGFLEKEMPKVLKILLAAPHLKLEGVMTHLYDAAALDNASSIQQLEIFDRVVEKVLAAGFNPSIIHVAATAGSVKVKSKFATAVRIGIGIYGINPLSLSDTQFDKLKDLKPVLSLVSTIMRTVDLKKGDKVGYEGTFVAKQPMRIGVIPMGYYEAIPRALSNRLGFVGRICMNMAMIDISKTNFKKGDEITIFSDKNDDENSITSIWRKFGLYPHEVLVDISETIRREIDFGG
ncbi:MAG: alanine racemase [Candidatus Nomurabacteria bacterium]|jgi:alanine racemase|nr:alanine racemase [Candidatus Nomurabacteria bacterium]